MLCNVQATLLSQNGIFPSIFRQDQTSTGVAARRPKQSQSGARRGVSSGHIAGFSRPDASPRLLILEEQLYRQYKCELPHAVDKALDAQLRVEYVSIPPLGVMYCLTCGSVPMDVESPISSEESSSDSSAAPDSSESDFARARPRRRMPARPRPARRNHADKENASSPARRPRELRGVLC